MDFDFPKKEGTGISSMMPHISVECQDLIMKMLIYNPDNRITATQALKHHYFKDLRDQEKRMKEQYAVTQTSMSPSMNAFKHVNGAENVSQYSKSDDVAAASDAGVGGDQHSNVGGIGHTIQKAGLTMKGGQMMKQLDKKSNQKRKGELKGFSGNNTFSSDSDELNQLPPLRAVNIPYKGGGMKNLGSQYLQSFKKTGKYVSPYSQKTIPKP